MKLAFLCNSDAELELADPEGYRPSARMRARMAAIGRSLRAPMCAGGEHEVWCVDADAPAPGGEGWFGVSWCPTPSALRRLHELGIRTGACPALSVLQRVNHRAFCSDLVQRLGVGLPGEGFVRAMEELDARLAAAPAPAGGYLLKRPFGFAGRWRKRVAGELPPPARRWAAASMQGYGLGLQIEPWVEVVQEVALHGFLAADGAAVFGAPTLVAGDGHGGFGGSRLAEAGELSTAEAQALMGCGREVAAALRDAGYFGPFGLDGFRWRGSNGGLGFRPLSEINARFTMGWWTGMGPGWWRLLGG